ncbi:amino acid adenylation domain-containing protein [Algibacter aquimarinus]|uniref:Amino acid adenylation domain-containing protein n=1 Tax=Algibacter aquimarinus TaxID=1136748 RepID=A0ABP9HKQ8_9FLAO
MTQPTIKQEEKSKFNPFAGPEIECVIHTTQAQEEIWTACKLGGANANRAYNESVSLSFTGTLDLKGMEFAFHTLVKRHESLRAVFSTDGRFMTIFKNIEVPFTFKDITDLSDKNKEEALANYLNEQTEHVFNLIKAPLINCGLIKISETESQLVLTAHHIICDGWSIGIMLQELGILYSAHVQSTSPELPNPEKFSYYADNQLALIKSDEYKEIQKFWVEKHEDLITPLSLPTDFPYPIKRTYKSQRFDFDFNKDLLNILKTTGREANSSLVTSLLAVFEIFLFKITGQDDIAVGLPAAGQSVVGMTHLVGHCANLLPLRTKINKKENFINYLRHRKSELFDAYDHQQLSFGHLLQMLAITRDPSRIPLVPVAFNIDLGMDDGVAFHDLSYKLISNPRKYEIFEIFLNAMGTQENLTFELAYNSALFKPETIKKMMVSFEELTHNLVSNPNKSIGEIINEDNLKFYNTLNNNKESYSNKPLHELLQIQADKSPKSIAIDFNDIETTYEDLQKKANQLAHYLLNQGVKPGDFIGVALIRSTELVATLMAILKCGAAYLPLDPSYPKKRLEFMLQDSEVKYLITNEASRNSFSNSINILFIEKALAILPKFPNTPLDIIVNQNSIAYLLYTSGSTGKPKGVPITHKSLVNLLFTMAKEPGIKNTDKQLTITTISFDIANVEIFSPLLNGACVVMTNSENSKDGRFLLNLLKDKKITILQATPTTWKMLLEANWSEKLKLKACCGGEALSKELAQKILSKCDSLWNMYGPTETTICATIKQIKPSDDIISIGKPVANYQLYILNPNGDLVPPGVVGQIAIAGDGVAKGYLKREDLTKEKFIENKFSHSNSNKTIYLTGDLGKLLPSGNVLCLGRLDDQVKIRGYRIELGEIEKTLINIDNIKSAVVLGHNDNLLAYVILEDFENVSQAKIKEWKNYLSLHLPAYFVPYDIRILKKFPTTPNGKLDRNALIEERTIEVLSSTPSTKPSNKTEKLVAEIWKEYLNLNKIDVLSNFFELGGHSLIALKVMNRIEKEMGKDLPLSALFEYSTIRTFSQLLDKEDKTIESWGSLVPIKPEGNKTPIYIVHGAGMEVLIFNALAKNLDKEQPVFGLQAKALFSSEKSFNSIEEIASLYVDSIIKHNPEGPYALAGYSFGGIIAYEMAKQLKEQNKKVNMVGLFDTIIEPHFNHASPLRKKIASFFYKTNRQIYFLREMMKSWEKFKFHINRKKEFILNQHFQTKTFLTEDEKLAHTHFLKTESIIQPIKKRYHIKKQNIRVDLFKAKDETAYTNDPVFYGWNKIALKGVSTHDIPGDHDGIFTKKNEKEVGRIFQNVLDSRNEVNKN